MHSIAQLFVASTLGQLALGAGPYVWPLPRQYTISDSLDTPLLSTFKIVIEGAASESTILLDAVDRYTDLTFPHTAESDPGDGASVLVISVASDDEDLQYGVDESYNLSFPSSSSSDTGVLSANTIYGAMRGLETFSQLVVYNFSLGYYRAYSSVIYDAPRFQHRGILVDTARHFQSVDSLKHVLLSMSYAKFNTFHWHIVDEQAFPYESKAYPKLWNGAYSQYERFSQSDVKEVVTYAKSLGIRVIPEFDMPGHASSWCVGYPDICPSSSCDSPLNPAVNETWELIDGLVKEATSIFFDNYFHLGGDEVNTDCWSSTESVQAWMTANNYTSKQALQYFDERAESIVYNKYKKQVINWVEVFNLFNTTLDPSVVTIEVWKAKTALQAVVAAGFNGILADSDLWYLDHLTVSWSDMYGNEPFEDITDVSQQNLILGGECCMWGETVDVSDIEQTIWPRAAAVAERLWSLQNVTDLQAAEPRIAYFRCLLNERGVAAAPLNNSEAREAPSGPGSCYEQRR